MQINIDLTLLIFSSFLTLIFSPLSGNKVSTLLIRHDLFTNAPLCF